MRTPAAPAVTFPSRPPTPHPNSLGCPDPISCWTIPVAGRREAVKSWSELGRFAAEGESHSTYGDERSDACDGSGVDSQVWQVWAFGNGGGAIASICCRPETY